MEDTNTLREEFYNWAMKQGDYIPMVNQMDWWLNKFNQKLEEIEREIEKERINIYPSNNVENYQEKEIRLNYYNQAINKALQIIKNKKI